MHSTEQWLADAGISFRQSREMHTDRDEQDLVRVGNNVIYGRRLRKNGLSLCKQILTRRKADGVGLFPARPPPGRERD